jgi:hypothetical protein
VVEADVCFVILIVESIYLGGRAGERAFSFFVRRCLLKHIPGNASPGLLVNSKKKPAFLVVPLWFMLFWLFAGEAAKGQFVAFNDHAPGTIGVTTHSNATTWNIFGNSPGASGALKDVVSGATLPVTVTITRSGIVNASTSAGNPSPGTPLYNTFNGYVDFLGAGDADAAAQVTGSSTVVYTFTGLTPGKVYSFKGSAVRNGGYANRWSLFELDGVRSFTSAHTAGAYTNGLAVNQVAINTGINTNGDMADWETIIPGANGSFSVLTTQYTNSIPTGGTADGPYCYALSGFQLEEKNPATNMTPVSVTGFNWDVVVENTATGPPYTSYAAELNPGEGNAYYQSGLSGKSYGLPVSGSFTSVLDGSTIFQFQPYTGNNALVLSSETGTSSATLTLATPGTYSRIAVIANAANATASTAGTLTLHFTDGSAYVTTYNAPDWFNNSGYALSGVERMNVNTGATSGATTNPRFCQTTIDLAALLGSNNKPLASLTFDMASPSQSTGIYAISGLLAIQTAPVFTSQPTNAVVSELSPAAFRATVTGSPTPSLQWHRNGVPVSGATNATYSIASAALADNGAQFRLVASNYFTGPLTATSSVAILTVIADTNPPVLLAAQSLGLTQVQLSFSERIKPSTATNAANFSISGTNGSVAISAAALDSSQSNIILTVAAMIDHAIYMAKVSNVADQSAGGNVIAPNSSAAFTAYSYVPFALGNPTPPGSQVLAGNGINVTGGGAGMGSTNDQCQLAYLSQTGDFDFKVRIDSLGLADAWSEAGMVAREDLTPGSRFAGVLATPTISGAFFESRSATNGPPVLAGSFPVSYPNTWLRLQRTGNIFNGFIGLDGTNWAQLGTVTLSLPSTIYFGFVVSSYNTNQVATAAFRDFGPVTTVGTAPPQPFESLGEASRSTPLVISEIMYHPTNSLLEFIELFNSRGEAQDISGYRLDGSISYTFPARTTIPGGGFVVVARSPADLQSAYGLAGVFGPYSKSLPGSGSVQLFNQSGALFFQVDYSGQPPWPVAADGAGHSLVLARPSYGENNPNAWVASDSVGGSPGRLDPVTPDPLRNVVINEFLAHTDPPDYDYIELYNYGAQPADISGCTLSDDPVTNRFVIPPGTILPPHGSVVYNETNMNFALSAGGETIYFKNATQTRVLDAVRFEGQENGVVTGRYPDGGDQFYRLTAKTPGTTNAPILVSDVVINEIMHNPISLDDDDQYVELYNQGTNAVDLGKWQFISGISFTFPPNTVVQAGDYLVVARNTARMLANYPNLNSGNLIGNFGGKLSHHGERLALAMWDTTVSTNHSGIVQTNDIYIPVDEVTYGTGGRWSQWSAAGGSSLELIDPHANHRLAPSWTDSDETHKVPWSIISATGTIDNGIVTADELQIILQGPGECLIDNIQVLDSSGNNLITNSTFETGAAGWTAEGTEKTSGLETSEGYNSSRCYHLRAVNKGDNQINRVRCLLSTPLVSGATNVTIRAAVRWLKGSPEILLRLRGNWLECAAELPTPVNPGTPGARNSAYVSNAPPAITGVQHSPILPQPNQPIVVTARVSDPDGIALVQLKYRLDPGLTYNSITMTDNGVGADAVAGDGIYSAKIPAQATGTMVAFYVQATDKAIPAATTTFPNNAPVRECLAQVGEGQPTGNLPVYRIWMTQANLNAWNNGLKLDNSDKDVTFVVGNERVIYNAGARYKGSPYISPGYCGATCGRCGYSISFGDDDLFLGENELVIDWPGGHGGETSALQEQMCYWIADQLNLPWSHRHTIRLHVNGVTDTARQATFEAIVQPAGGFVKEWAPNDSNGELFKIERAFEFSDSASLIADPEPRLQLYTTTGGLKKREKYRWTWMFRSTDRRDDYTNIFALVDAVNSASPEPYTSAVTSLVDVEEWMRIFATEHIIVNFDAYGHDIGKNMYGYLPPNGKWQLYMFDLDWAMLAGNPRSGNYSASTATLFNAEDPTITRMFAFPPFARAYWRAVQDAVNGPMQATNCNPVMDAKYRSLIANGVAWCDGSALTDASVVKTWFSQRLAYLQGQLATVASPFAVTSTVVTNNVAVLSGTAPVGVGSIWINGAAWPLSWTSVNNWTARVVPQPGTNQLSVVGVDTHNQPVPGASNSVVAVLNGIPSSPVGQVVVNEIMCQPSATNGQYVELYNNSPNLAVDLSGWDFHGLSYTFPGGSLLAPNSFLVLAANRADFAAAYGATNPVFDIFSGTLQPDGETLSLVKPGTNSASDLTVTKVRYATALPWPTNVNGNGSSLQLLDPLQDNWRAGNWKAGSPAPSLSPGKTNTIAVNLPPFPPLWINEVQADNLTGITNRAGQRTPWLELYNRGLNVVFLTNLFLANNYTNLTNWAFPSGATINPGEFKVIFADGQTNLSTLAELHTSFTLSSISGSVALSRLFNGQPQVLDFVDYSGLGLNHSYGSLPDGQSFTRQEFFFVTPGGTNNRSSALLTVVINEWMAGNTHTLLDPVTEKYSDWFELYNYGTNTANLAGYYLTDDLTNKFKVEIPAGYTIPPHGFLLVWADSKQTNGTPDLHVNFKLSKNGESIGLYGADGQVVDYVNYGPQSDDISEGRFPDGAPGLYFMPTATPRTNNMVPNTPPSLAPIADRLVTLRRTVTLTASATDTDQPPQTLTFSLGAGAPAGAAVNPSTGLFTWTPSSAPWTNVVTLIVTDNGTPNLSASQTFKLTVFPPPELSGFSLNGNQLTFSFQTVPGQNYQLEYKDDLPATDWIPIDAPIIGTGGFVALTTDVSLSAQRFYHLRLVP